jgi:hypothetical protein
VEAAPLVLAYAPAQGVSARDRFWQFLSALWLLPALVAPFLPFTWHTSPYDAAREFYGTHFGSDFPLVCVGLSFFLIYPMLGWRLRRLLWRRAGTTELFIALAGALVAAAPIFIVAGYMMLEVVRWITERQIPIDAIEWASLIGLMGGLAAGMVMAIRLRRRDGAVAMEALLVGAYLANVVLCLLSFCRDPDVGYWVTLAATAVLAVQFARLPAAARHAHVE